jgi:glycosyltransferase involved in cell wall biosynthesis
VFGYIGTIHPDRVDVELVEAIGRQLTAGSIVLIGPNMLSRGDSARLVAAGSVILAGQAPYSRLPQLMRAFDVSITPHRMTPFTESLNPIKLWEYLAAGKPIVATDIAGFRDYPKHVRLASNAASFHLAMLEALGEPAADREARRNAAAGHSWNTRVDDIVAVINSVAHG